MYYVIKLPSGIGRITMEKPKDNVDYIQTDILPTGSGALRFDNEGNLFFGASPKNTTLSTEDPISENLGVEELKKEVEDLKAVIDALMEGIV